MIEFLKKNDYIEQTNKYITKHFPNIQNPFSFIRNPFYLLIFLATLHMFYRNNNYIFSTTMEPNGSINYTTVGNYSGGGNKLNYAPSYNPLVYGSWMGLASPNKKNSGITTVSNN